MGLSSTDPGVGGWGRVDTRGRGDRRGRVVSREAGYYRRRVARGTRGSYYRGRTSHTLHLLSEFFVFGSKSSRGAVRVQNPRGAGARREAARSAAGGGARRGGSKEP